MKRKAISQFILGGILLVLFVLFTWSLTLIDMQPIGPNGSSVAYANINQAVHNLFGVNMTLYNITDWPSCSDQWYFGSIVPIFYNHACHVCIANCYDAVPPTDSESENQKDGKSSVRFVYCFYGNRTACLQCPLVYRYIRRAAFQYCYDCALLLRKQLYSGKRGEES